MCQKYAPFLVLLRRELVPALGCTEPIAIAFAAARAREVLGKEPQRIEVLCSGNVIKNVKSVIVPNSGGMKGIAAAAVLGAMGGNAALGLETLRNVTPAHRERAQHLLERNFCSCGVLAGAQNLHILVNAYCGGQSATVEVKGGHTHIIRIEKDGETLFRERLDEDAGDDFPEMTLEKIYAFVQSVPIELVEPILAQQLTLNRAISQEGLAHVYGAQVGRTLMADGRVDVATRARASAAAGSDARMSGCAMPVVINSGSGNQGLAASLPVYEYALELGAPREKMLRALALSNLVAIYQKRYIGNLSAYCGAVCAACGSGAGITYLYDGTPEQIAQTVVNTIVCVGGIVCDGAKASCAAKISACVDSAIQAHCLAMQERGFRPGEGLVKKTADETIRCMGYVAKTGMKETDERILEKMMEPL